MIDTTGQYLLARWYRLIRWFDLLTIIRKNENTMGRSNSEGLKLCGFWFCPHTYTRTRQFLSPLMGDNYRRELFTWLLTQIILLYYPNAKIKLIIYLLRKCSSYFFLSMKLLSLILSPIFSNINVLLHH